jgi:hypothetical protein
MGMQVAWKRIGIVLVHAPHVTGGLDCGFASYAARGYDGDEVAIFQRRRRLLPATPYINFETCE